MDSITAKSLAIYVRLRYSKPPILFLVVTHSQVNRAIRVFFSHYYILRQQHFFKEATFEKQFF
jgi:hypothetical protein